jgi:hypothetical protein
MSRYAIIIPAMACVAVALSGCGGDATPTNAGDSTEVANAAATAFPANLAAGDEGYPATGDPCRRLGESDRTRNWLDDSADLVGCPTASAAAALNGNIIATVEGITIVSVPRQAASGGESEGTGDALVAGTSFNATADIRCSMDGSAPTAMCSAGVRRGAGSDGATFVEITRPNGLPRVIFFQGTRAMSADSAQADGSAAYAFSAARSGDETTISFGPERYIIPDALVEGG